MRALTEAAPDQVIQVIRWRGSTREDAIDERSVDPDGAAIFCTQPKRPAPRLDRHALVMADRQPTAHSRGPLPHPRDRASLLRRL
jgi:hypothetical protein